MTLSLQKEKVFFSEENIQLIKDTVCKGASDGDLQVFLHVCEKTRLDPFTRQIYSIARGSQRTIQTSIDGFRLIADRTGLYAPGKESKYVYDNNGNIISCTSYIKKMTRDKTWHEISCTAYMSEYNTNQGMWKKMPHVMLAKCAEAQALRRAFPDALSNVYSDDEMQQCDFKNKDTIEISANESRAISQEEKNTEETISEQDIQILKEALKDCDEEFRNKVSPVLPKLTLNRLAGAKKSIFEQRDSYQLQKKVKKEIPEEAPF